MLSRQPIVIVFERLSFGISTFHLERVISPGRRLPRHYLIETSTWFQHAQRQNSKIVKVVNKKFTRFLLGFWYIRLFVRFRFQH